MNNTTIINIFNCDNSNITRSKTLHLPVMTTITDIILKLKSMVKNPIVNNHTFFTVITYININTFRKYYSIVMQDL